MFMLMYFVLAVYVHRAFNQFNLLVKGYTTKGTASVEFAWNIRFKFVSLLGVHAIQVIVCVVAMFYMILPHADIGHASVILVMAVKAVVMVAGLFGLLGSSRESKWLMSGCLLALLGELVFFVVLGWSVIMNNKAYLVSDNPAELIMVYGALSSLVLSIIFILLSIMYAFMTMKTFNFGLKEWVKVEYDKAVDTASTNPFKA